MVRGKPGSLGPAPLPTLPHLPSLLQKFTASLHPTATARERGAGSANKQPHPFTVHRLTRTEMNCPNGKMPTLFRGWLQRPRGQGG